MPHMWDRKAPLAAVLIALSLALPASAEETRQHRAGSVTLNVTSIAGGLEHPWSVEVLPDGGYIVTERPGRMRIIRNGTVGQPLLGLPRVAATGQGGLLDVALAPDFDQSRTLFFTAAVPGQGGQGTGVFVARLSADEQRLEEVRRIFLMNKLTRTGQHFGSRIAIAADGSLFFGIGDRGDEDRAQDALDHAGKILRINPDGSPAANLQGQKLPEVWSSGHRNPQGIAIDPVDNRLYTVEHGARGGDEINSPEQGNNYGWPIISHGKHYSGAEIGIGQSADGYEQPLYYWDPSIAPGALAVYRGAMFPEWDGDFLVAALKYQLVARIERGDDGTIVREDRMLQGEYGRIRDITVAPDGSILLVTDEEDGQLLRITKADES